MFRHAWGVRELHRRRVVFPRERIDARLLQDGHVRPRLAVLPEAAEEAENRERSSRSKPGGRIRYLPLAPLFGSGEVGAERSLKRRVEKLFCYDPAVTTNGPFHLNAGPESRQKNIN